MFARLTLLTWTLVLAFASLPVGSVCAEETTPPELEGVGIVEHLGDTLPLDLMFVNSEGRAVRLGDYFDGTRPTILNLVYFNCPMLCNLVLNGLTEGMASLDWTAGKEFQVLTLSIDAREKSDLAAAKKKNHLEQLGRSEAGAGWHFLTGDQASIRTLADAVGFSFKYDAERMEYAHGAALFMVSPKGKLTRYLYGITYPEKQLKLALTEAGEGTVGSALDQFVLRCYHFDPDSRKYGIYIWGVMRLGGLATVLLIGLMLAIFWRRERRRGTVRASTNRVLTESDAGLMAPGHE
jgi:protein SCO1/2